MSATTFEPEGQLTGFQWAKMLLCAVGFGSQGEFTGNSWSLNTAKVAHLVGLFDGDLAGADHVALQRQQAMLYAFNVLTTVPQVTYSPNVSGYIEGIWGYVTVTPLGQTLGQSIYKLNSKTGIIVDNEGMGASVTYLDYGATSDLKVKADTGLDMMYHAARIWYVEGTKANTGVFVLDLAKVETTNCPSATTIAALKGNYKTIGENGVDNAVPYQLDVIDNSAIDAGKTNVVFNYYTTVRGPVSTAADTTVIGPGNGSGPAVPNSKIKTDISAIEYLDNIIVLYATSTKEKVSDGAYAYYVYAPTATSGVITKIASDGTVTLRDGTTIGKSRLATDLTLTTSDIGVSYTFVLDTHGHYYAIQQNVTLVYYTGAYTRDTSGDYVGEYVYNAQVVNVSTGEPSLVRVKGTWNSGNSVVDSIDNMVAGYYWLGEPSLAGVYTPSSWGSDYLYLGGYIHGIETSFANTSGIKVINHDGGFNDSVYYTGDSVKFIIATGKGTNLDIKTYNGVAELIAGYNVSGATTGTVTLDDMALTTYVTKYDNVDTTVVFAYKAETTSRYVFVPYNISASDWNYAYETTTGDKMYCYTGEAYLNGNAIDIYYSAQTNLDRGFYTYDTDAAGNVTINPTFHVGNWVYEDENLIGSGTTVAQVSETLNKRVYFAEDLVVVDLRKGVIVTEDVDAIKTLEDIKYYDEPNLQLAYTLNAAGQIDVCYVVEQNLGVVDVTIDEDATTGGSNPAEYALTSSKLYEDSVKVTLSIPSSANVTVAENALVDVDASLYYSSNNGRTYLPYGKSIVGDGVVAKDGKINVTFKIPSDVRGTYAYKIVITGVTFKDFVITNEAINFAFTVSFEEYVEITTKDNMYKVENLKLGDGFSIGLAKDSVVNDTYATATIENYGNVSNTFNGGKAWFAIVPTSNAKLTIQKVESTYKFVLSDSDFTWWGTGTSATNAYEFTCEPGSASDVKLHVAGDLTAASAQRTDHVYMKFGGATEVISQETKNDMLGTKTATFVKVVPSGVSVVDNVNVVTITTSKWAADDNSSVTNP